MLTHDAFERNGLLEELAAGAPRLGRLLHGFAPLSLQLVERQDQLAQCVDEGQAYQQEAQKNEFEEGARVVHRSDRYNLRQL